MNILVLHGPNLNLLGLREPDVYGKETLDDINGKLQAIASEHGVTLRIVQSNHEGVSIAKPCIEAHLSNVHKREEFRHTSVIAPVCVGQIMGLGWRSYTLGLTGLIQILDKR
jgi:3-dehydroquinate dehydratase-2